MNKMFLDRSRNTSCKAGHDGAASSGASKSFSTHAENRFSVARFQVLRRGQTVPAVALGRWRLVAAYRYLARAVAARASARERRAPCPCGGGRHFSEPEIWWSAEALTRFRRDASIRRNQRQFTFDLHARRAKTIRKGAPFHGAIGEDRTAMSAILAGTLGLSWCGREGKQCTCDQQRCCYGSGKACCKQLSPLPEQIVGRKQDTRSVQTGNRRPLALEFKIRDYCVSPPPI